MLSVGGNIINRNWYNTFTISGHKNLELKLSSIRHVLKSLPKQHYDTLMYVTRHLNRSVKDRTNFVPLKSWSNFRLRRIASCSAINKMNPHNLATVFAPTLIGPPESTDTILPDISSDILLIETLIFHYDKVFYEERKSFQYN